MSDIMYPVSFDKLMNHILQEYALHQRIYNVTKIHHYEGTKVLKLFGKTLENPLGPAAGPHTQLAQNIIGRLCGRRTVYRIENRANHVRRRTWYSETMHLLQ